MGQDVSVIFAGTSVSDETLMDAATSAFSEVPSGNLVLVVSSESPVSIRNSFKASTSLSLWGDMEEGLARFAIQLSRSVTPCVVLTMADHSCIGGWQIYEGGKPGAGKWVEGNRYTEAGIHGIEVAFGVELSVNDKERPFFTESLLKEPRGICVLGATKILIPGAPLTPAQVRAMMEHDLPEIELESLLLIGEE